MRPGAGRAVGRVRATGRRSGRLRRGSRLCYLFGAQDDGDVGLGIGSTMSNEVTCGECGELIEGEPPIPDDPAQRKPCPRCGSTSRKQGISARLQTASFATGTITVIPYAETLLAKSQELISSGDFNIATVVAHMACEIAAERAISLAFASRGLGYFRGCRH